MRTYNIHAKYGATSLPRLNQVVAQTCSNRTGDCFSFFKEEKQKNFIENLVPFDADVASVFASFCDVKHST